MSELRWCVPVYDHLEGSTGVSAQLLTLPFIGMQYKVQRWLSQKPPNLHPSCDHLTAPVAERGMNLCFTVKLKSIL